MKYDTEIYREEIKRADYSKAGKTLGQDIRRRMLLLCDIIDDSQATIENMKKRIEDARNDMLKTANDWGL